MNAKIKADVRAYVNSVEKAWRATDEAAKTRRRRHERTWNIVGVVLATILVVYVLFSAWMKASGQW